MKKTISIYNVLKVCNFLVLLLMMLTYYYNGDTSYVDGNTILINTIQILITHIVLNNAAKNKNALLVLLSYVMIFHFQLRVVTLNYTEYSSIFPELNTTITSEKINEVLILEVLMYYVLYVSMRCRRSTKRLRLQEKELRDNASRNILLFVYVILFLNIFSYLGVPLISQIVGVLLTYFFNIFSMILMTICFFIRYWKRETFTRKFFFLLLLLLYVIVFTAFGSRSTIYMLGLIFFYCLLVLGKTNINVKYLVLTVALVPIMIVGFIYATLSRQLDMRKASFREKVILASELSSRYDGVDMKTLLSPVFNRIAFFDFAVQMIQDKSHLENYLTPTNYVKSVIDNILTPGFDLFDMPRMSLVVDKCYIYKEPPNKKNYHLDEAYLSSGLSLYGEAFFLFGIYLCFFYIYFVGYVFKIIYVKNMSDASIHYLWVRAILLCLFYSVLNSYGLDWFFVDLVAFFINFYIFKKLVYVKKQHSLIRT